MAAFCLDLHAGYRCGRSGACCESWAVPAESDVVELVRLRGVRRNGIDGNLFLESRGADGDLTWVVARDRRGDCVFFDRDRGHACVIHEQAGVDALPSACRHFPRRVIHDERGTLVSLSHFCPTAARLLMAKRAPCIVAADAPLCLSRRMEGLDALGALPPLLRPGLLTDLEGYDAWERAVLRTLARDDVGYDGCLDIVAAATEIVRQWQPGNCSMKEAVSRAFADAVPVWERPTWSQPAALQRIAELTRQRADIQVIDDFEEHWTRVGWSAMNQFDRAMKNYLAARVFGNWIAYQGRGLRTVVEWLRTCAAAVAHEMLRRVLDGDSVDDLMFVESLRSADLLLLHVVDSADFGRCVAPIEGPCLV